MSVVAFSAAVAALVTSILAAPLSSSPASISSVSLARRENTLVKRAPQGPQIGGANFPDPSITKNGSTWYSFGTSSGGINIQVASSPDFSTWTFVSNSDGSQADALPTLPAWVDAQTPAVWAPDVSQLDDGSWVMYFTAATAQSSAHHCIGAATAPDVAGPYTAGANPLICDLSTGGQIDPAGFADTDGQRYVVWKVDGNSDASSDGQTGPCGATDNSTPLTLQAVAADGVTLQGDATTLLDNCDFTHSCAAGTTDDGIVEAPSLARAADGTYVLFFSSGCYSTDDYKVQYATSASSVSGPYERASAPLLATGSDGLSAPGGASIYADAMHFVFHADSSAGRSLYTDLVSISGNTVTA